MRELRRRRWLPGILIVLCVLMSARCTMLESRPGGLAPHVVRMEGVERCLNYWSLQGASAREGRPLGVLARDGELFNCKHGQEGEESIFPYRGADGESLSLDMHEDVVFLNGRAVSIQLDAESAGWAWLRDASIEGLSGLRLLSFDDAPDPLDFPLLEKVARVRPDIGLMVSDIDQPDVVTRLVSLFEPRLLVISADVLSQQFEALAPRLMKLQSLYIGEEKERASLDFLPRLPRLHTLSLEGWDPATSGDIPGGNRRLRSLAVWAFEGENLSSLRNLTGLEELVLLSGENLMDISALADLPGLRKLLLLVRSVPDLSVLEKLPKLTWLGFPTGTTQEAFARVIASHPGLEVVELHSDHVRDLSPLKSLRHLEAAILSQDDLDVSVLQDLKSLRYLGLPEEAFEGEAAAQTAALEQALPDTFVAQWEPLCLGSGWILLLIPAVILLRCLAARGYDSRAAGHA